MLYYGVPGLLNVADSKDSRQELLLQSGTYERVPSSAYCWPFFVHFWCTFSDLPTRIIHRAQHSAPLWARAFHSPDGMMRPPLEQRAKHSQWYENQQQKQQNSTSKQRTEDREPASQTDRQRANFFFSWYIRSTWYDTCVYCWVRSIWYCSTLHTSILLLSSTWSIFNCSYSRTRM